MLHFLFHFLGAEMKYLVEHRETFYYRRKIHYQTLCVSLKTKNKVEAKYVLGIINSNIEVLRYHMNFEEELDYIKDIIHKYVDLAKVQYKELADKREEKYSYFKKDGKKLKGSHPKAIKKAIKNLEEDLHSDRNNQLAQEIADASNIKEEFRIALQTLSKESQQRLRDEIIKAEIELLYFDKMRNESRSDDDKLQPTYIQEAISPKQTTYNDAIEMITMIDKQSKDKYRLKNKNEVYVEYIELMKDQKPAEFDKINLVIKTLLQSADTEYLIDYTMADYERFFYALIYTPAGISLKKRLFKAYDENIVLIAEDFKMSLENNDENFGEEFNYELKLQSAANISEKLRHLDDFLNDCVTNDAVEKNVMLNNRKFSDKIYKNILKSATKRKPFNTDELKSMLGLMAAEINGLGFMAEPFYIPLIALYSGMRVEEICKLKTKDIALENDVYYFNINGAVKTENSIRCVPIHSDLLNCFDFLKYLKTREKNEFLFNLSPLEIKATKKTKYSHYYLRDFTRIRDNCVSEERIENDLISFHSFRHTFATRLHQSGVPYTIISALLGHRLDTVMQMFENIVLNHSQSETERYIHEGKPNLKQLEENINKLYLEDIKENIDLLAKAFKNCSDKGF